MIHVIIPVHIRLEFTIDCINSIYKQKQKDKIKIIIVDDGSIDGTSQYIKKVSKVKILKVQNLYCNAAINFLRKKLKNDWVLLMNNDVLLSKDVLIKLKNIMRLIKKIDTSALTVSNMTKKIIKTGSIVKSWMLNITKHVFVV